jgi:cyclohexadienyl dehydratase
VKPSKRIQYAITFSFLFLGFGCALAGGSTPDPSPEGADPIRVATSGDYLPFSDWPAGDVDHAGGPRGFSIDVANAFADARGVEIDWVRFAWPELLADLTDGRFDLAISGITVRAERSIAGLFSIAVTRSGAVILVDRESGYETRADLENGGVRLAVNSGGHLERVARRLFPAARIEAVPANADVLGRLLDGRADAAVTDSLEAPHWIASAGRPLHVIGPLTSDRKAALFPSARQALARDFDQWLLDAEAKGVLSQLRARHRIPADATATPVPALLSSLDERLALMAGVAQAKFELAIPIEDVAVETRVQGSAWRSVERESRALGRAAPTRDRVDALFRAQIEAAKWVQHRELDRRRADVATHTSAAVVAEHARDRLDSALRPALIRIGDRIAFLVARLTPAETKSLEFETVRSALARHALPEAELRALHDAIVRLRTVATPHAAVRHGERTERHDATAEGHDTTDEGHDAADDRCD